MKENVREKKKVEKWKRRLYKGLLFVIARMISAKGRKKNKIEVTDGLIMD